MKKVIAISISFLILLTSVKDVATYGYFYLNQEYITDLFCINKDKPEILCSGKCYLKASLAENQEEKEEKSSRTQQEERPIYLLPIVIQRLNFENDIHIERVTNAYQSTFYSFQHLEDIFHPPQFLA